MQYVYVLRSQSHPDRFYTGLATDVTSRLREHNSGRAFHTAKYRPWQLVVALCFDSDDCASAFERYMKSGSGRAFAKKHFW